jgi:hypothetical protein
MSLVTILLLGLGGCAAHTPVPHTRPPSTALAFSKQELALHLGGVTYDLLGAAPVRSARVFDLLSRETFTRRYFVTHSEGRQYAFKTEQREGELYPRTILVETRNGFRRVVLDTAGNILRADAARDLGE